MTIAGVLSSQKPFDYELDSARLEKYSTPMARHAFGSSVVGFRTGNHLYAYLDREAIFRAIQPKYQRH